MKYDYTLCPEADNSAFMLQCEVLQRNGFSLNEELIDADGSIIRKYKDESREVTIWLDFYIDAVYMKSDTPSDDLLADKPCRVDITE